jgi:aryl-alcohol dehydrogenase-like predicted oxidoreductase
MSIERATLAPGYQSSRLIKGCWHLAGGHGPVDGPKAIEDMASFVEAGVTTFDCADHYTGVEELIGQFRQKYPGLAAQQQVHTKCVPDYDHLGHCDRTYLTAIIDRSLRRLGQEQLDLVQFHWWRMETQGYVEAMSVLNDLRISGKIKHLGLTNFNSIATREILRANIPIVSTQVQYSLLDARSEHSLISLCAENHVQLLCYGTLAGGLLSQHWLGQPEPHEPFVNRSHTKYKLIIEDFGGWSLFQRLLQALSVIAERRHVSISEVASRWVWDKAQVAGVIIGFTSAKHLAASIRIGTFELTEADTALLAPILAERRGPAGDCYDIERDKTGRHGRIMRYNQNEGRH